MTREKVEWASQSEPGLTPESGAVSHHLLLCERASWLQLQEWRRQQVSPQTPQHAQLCAESSGDLEETNFVFSWLAYPLVEDKPMRLAENQVKQYVTSC